MHHRALVALPFLALALAGCPSKPKTGECRSSQDCEAQEGYGKICVEGRCQECGQDTDCKAGFVCRENKCTPRPECEKDTDCAAGQSCQAGRCVAAAPKAECKQDADCGAGKTCDNGRCVAAVAQAAPAAAACDNLEPIQFGFDEATLSSDARSGLDRVAACIKDAKPKRLTIAGNCDERGTTEYNLHLGQRRADSAKKYLQNLGVDSKVLKTVSYGKERPLCNDHDESCWAKNRRDDFNKE
jgi:peptidoglycan-associated lipoprotein